MASTDSGSEGDRILRTAGALAASRDAGKAEVAADALRHVDNAPNRWTEPRNPTNSAPTAFDRCSRREAAFRQNPSARVPRWHSKSVRSLPRWHAKFVGCLGGRQGNFYAVLARIAPKQTPPREVGGDRTQA
jgi:hypothetical protein